MFGVLKPFYGILVSFFPQKGVGGGAFIHYTSRYSITQELLQLLDEFSFSYLFLFFFFFFDRHPQLVYEHVKEPNYMCHTQKRTCLARPVVCLNRTLTTFENAMFLSYLRMTRWFSPKSSIFSTTYRMAQAQNE